MLVVPNGDYPNAVGENPIKQMVREAFEICSPQVSPIRVEPQWIRSRRVDVFVQFSPELVSKPN